MESMNLNWMLVNKLSVWDVVQSKAENAIFFLLLNRCWECHLSIKGDSHEHTV